MPDDPTPSFEIKDMDSMIDLLGRAGHFMPKSYTLSFQPFFLFRMRYIQVGIGLGTWCSQHKQNKFSHSGK